jgi:transposase
VSKIILPQECSGVESDMAMGTRKGRERQEEIWYRSELAEAPGHPFYRKLEEKLKEFGFDALCEEECKRYYAEGVGRPSLAPGVYFRLMLIGFFEGLDSERGIAWRVADSLSLREFLGYGIDENTPDHVTISRTRRLLDPGTHHKIFEWALEKLGQAGLVKGKTMGVDSTTLEANAAMKSIVRRDTGDSYMGYLKKVAEAEGIPAPDKAALLRMDRKRKKKTSNEDWTSPADAEAEITKLKDGRTALAYKVEQAVDMDTGAIVAVTTHGGAAGDAETVAETLCEAGLAVAELIEVKDASGQYPVNREGIAEVVADKGYHSNQSMVEIQELGLRSYVAEPDRGRRNWQGKPEQRDAVYANRRRVRGERGKRLQAQRGEKLERNFAHQFDTGGMDRLWLRGRENVHKRLLVQAAACNLALLLRSMYGVGKPRAAHDRKAKLILSFLRLLDALIDPGCAYPADRPATNAGRSGVRGRGSFRGCSRKWAV